MKVVRSLIVILEMLIFALGAIIIGFIIIPLSTFKFDENEKRKYCANVVHKSWNFFCKMLCAFHTIEIEINDELKNISQKVIVASHPSLLDIVILIGLIPNCLCIAKKELLKNPIMHNIVKSLYIINDIELKEFQEETKKALESGFNIIIFPTGTRTLENEEIKIHKGAAQIAIYANEDIIPIKIETNYPLLTKNHFSLDAGTKQIKYTITRKNGIEINKYKNLNLSEIKLRKLLSEKIKEEIK